MQKELAALEQEVYRLRPTVEELDRLAVRCNSEDVMKLLLQVHETQAALEARVEALEKEAQIGRLESRLPAAPQPTTQTTDLQAQLEAREEELQEVLTEAARTKQLVRAFLQAG